MNTEQVRFDFSGCIVISCAMVIEEMLPLMPPGMSYEVLEAGLHADPGKLNRALQKAIDACGEGVRTIILGYGLCSQAVVGLRSDKQTLVIPRVDDCIGLFLGSSAEYKLQHEKVPGSLYLTKGWIESGSTPYEGYDEIVRRYGELRAKSFYKTMIRNYTRLVFINTGNYEIERYRTLSKKRAEELGLRFEEIKGSNRLLIRLLSGLFDGEFVIVPPGRKVSFQDFRNG